MIRTTLLSYKQDRQGKFTPVAKLGSSKYRNCGKCSGTLILGMNLSEEKKKALIETGNHGLV